VNADGLQRMKITPEAAGDGLRLSRMAKWNQTPEDWAFLLQHGSGLGFQTDDGLLVASMLTLPVGPRHGWISMVLTDPEWRRKGLARDLMQEGMANLEEQGLVPTLDATPAGEQVYRAIGFTGETELARWIVTPGHDGMVEGFAESSGIRPVEGADLERLAAWDTIHSGCERGAMLQYLFSSRSDLAFMEVAVDGALAGFIMGRAGDRRTQLGPLVAVNSETAVRLFAAALAEEGGPVYVDAFDERQPLLAADAAFKWSCERTFKRMVLGNDPLPGNPPDLYLAAGPELG
jgi:ribosomal protein S18 acetylase RimI-like enzyme